MSSFLRSFFSSIGVTHKKKVSGGPVALPGNDYWGKEEEVRGEEGGEAGIIRKGGMRSARGGEGRGRVASLAI